MPRITLSDRVVGARIRKARQRKGLRQIDLGEALGVGPTTVQQWETGTSGLPERRIHALAEVLGIPAAELYPGDFVEVTPDERDLLEAYRRIGTPFGRQRVMAQLEIGRRMASC